MSDGVTVNKSALIDAVMKQKVEAAEETYTDVIKILEQMNEHRAVGMVRAMREGFRKEFKQ